MTKRIISSQGANYNPTVRLTDKKGSRFVGRFISAKTSKKGGKIYDFAALDGDALITKKQGDAYVEATIAEGATVSLFGGKAIDDAMTVVNAGDVVEFVFNGQKKLDGGRSFNDIAIAIIDEVK